MHRDELIELLTKAFEKGADRLEVQGRQDQWPEDLQARDIVRLLREHSPEVIAKVYNKDNKQ